MINKIELTNFQSHPHSVFEFDRGVNAIIGPSDSGKTAVLRAIRWVIWNRPLGDSFRSVWGGDTSVSIYVPENIIMRWKHDNGHGYNINGSKLTAIKTDVPEEVASIINVDSVNLQQQFDRPFLLDSSPGEVAAHFNNIAHLDIIDTTIKTLTSWQRKLNQNVQEFEHKIDEYETALTKFDYLPEMEKKIVKAEKYQETIDQLNVDIDALSKVIDTLENIELEMEELTPVLSLEKYVDAYTTLRDKKMSMESEQETLSSLVDELNESVIVLRKLEALPTKETCVDEALKAFQTIRDLRTDKDSLQSLVSYVKEAESELYNMTESINILQDEFNAQFPDVCPLCGSRKKVRK